MDELHHLPIDGNAAKVIFAKGEHYNPKKKVLTADSDLPLPTRAITKGMRNAEGFMDVTGVRNGLLTCLGLSANTLSMWVVRCDCGKYSERSKKAMLNKENYMDRCEHCRQLVYLKRESFYRKYGKEMTSEMLYGK
jgi:hypothetical protein